MIIEIKVIPQSRENKIEKIELGSDNKVTAKVRTTAPPVDGKANVAIIELMAKYFGVKKSAINIKSGLTSRNKKIEIKGLELKDIKHIQLPLC